jgi:hypothetical protein
VMLIKIAIGDRGNYLIALIINKVAGRGSASVLLPTIPSLTSTLDRVDSLTRWVQEFQVLRKNRFLKKIYATRHLRAFKSLRTRFLHPRISKRLAPAVQGIELGHMSASTSVVSWLGSSHNQNRLGTGLNSSVLEEVCIFA